VARRSRRNAIGTTLVLTVLAVVVLGSLTAGVVSGRARSSTPGTGGSSPATSPASGQQTGEAASASPSPSVSSTKKASASPTPAADESAAAEKSGARAASLEAAQKVTVPILMYHHIAPPEGGDTSYLWVSPSAFAAQMKQLHDGGYEAVTLAQVFDFWEENEPLPEKPVVISFDDGILDVYTEAAPVLEKYGWVGVMNINTWAITGGAEYAMTRGQMMRLVNRGWEVGCHSTSHQNMTTLSDAELEEEIVLARERIEFLLKTEIEFFCYPGGAYDDRVMAAVKAAGYRGATSVDRGFARYSERWRLRRITPTESGLNIPST
jgi:peptidoglycan/xylan/chitin deacetylase (PgdA/CDA1 family)